MKYPNVKPTGKIRTECPEEARQVRKALKVVFPDAGVFESRFCDRVLGICWTRNHIQGFMNGSSFASNTSAPHRLSDFNLKPGGEPMGEGLTFADLKVGDLVSTPHYGDGKVVEITELNEVMVHLPEMRSTYNYIDGGNTKRHQISSLTRREPDPTNTIHPAPEPAPEDKPIPTYNFGDKLRHEASGTPRYFIYAIRDQIFACKSPEHFESWHSDARGQPATPAMCHHSKLTPWVSEPVTGELSTGHTFTVSDEGVVVDIPFGGRGQTLPSQDLDRLTAALAQFRAQ